MILLSVSFESVLLIWCRPFGWDPCHVIGKPWKVGNENGFGIYENPLGLSERPKQKGNCVRDLKQRFIFWNDLYFENTCIQFLFCSPLFWLGLLDSFKCLFRVENSRPSLEAWQASLRRLAVPILNISVLFLFAHKNMFKFAAKLSPRKRKTRKPSFAAKSKPSGYLSGPPGNSVPFPNSSRPPGGLSKNELKLFCSLVFLLGMKAF